jgi:hypothetical protein
MGLARGAIKRGVFWEPGQKGRSGELAGGLAMRWLGLAFKGVL